MATEAQLHGRAKHGEERIRAEVLAEYHERPRRGFKVECRTTTEPKGIPEQNR